MISIITEAKSGIQNENILKKLVEQLNKAEAKISTGQEQMTRAGQAESKEKSTDKPDKEIKHIITILEQQAQILCKELNTETQVM
jgi:hypothetical protein